MEVQQENELERALRLAADEPAHRPEFYRTLLKSKVYVLGKVGTGEVKRAFLALMHDPSMDEKPHIVIGIEADGDITVIFREAGNVAADCATPGEPVDMIRVTEDDTGISSYMLSQTKPFYERRWGAKLRSMFSAGKA
jgi:hypothetical protein